jgi:hypothetical protein
MRKKSVKRRSSGPQGFMSLQEYRRQVKVFPRCTIIINEYSRTKSLHEDVSDG